MLELLGPLLTTLKPVVGVRPNVNRSVTPYKMYVSDPKLFVPDDLTSKTYGSTRTCPCGNVAAEAASMGPVHHASESGCGVGAEVSCCANAVPTQSKPIASARVADRAKIFVSQRNMLLDTNAVTR